MDKQVVETDNKSGKSHTTGIILGLSAAIISSTYSPFSEIVTKNGLSHYLFSGFAFLGGVLFCGIALLVQLILTRKDKEKRLLLKTKRDWLFTLLSSVFGVFANLCLMTALSIAPASQVTLYSNFEIIFTTFLAYFVFKEVVSWYSWAAIPFIACGAILLSLDFSSGNGVGFSWASVISLGSALGWALENNCSKQVSSKNTFEVVLIKSSVSALVELAIGFGIGYKTITSYVAPLSSFGIGILCVGLYYFLYIQAQKRIGAVRTSCMYSVSPFLGSIISMVINMKWPVWNFYVAFCFIAIGQLLVVIGMLKNDSRNRKDKGKLTKK
jgi:drug/metabolite transporter (DMT)-like permease